MKCIKCGNEIPNESLFCTNCGAKQVSEGTQAPQANKIDIQIPNVNLEKGKEISKNVLGIILTRLKNPAFYDVVDKPAIYTTLVLEILSVMFCLYLPIASVANGINSMIKSAAGGGFGGFLSGLSVKPDYVKLILFSLVIYFGIFLIRYLICKYINKNVNSVMDELFVFVNDFVHPAAFMVISSIIGLVSWQIELFVILVNVIYLSLMLIDSVKVQKYYLRTAVKTIAVFVIFVGVVSIVYSVFMSTTIEIVNHDYGIMQSFKISEFIEEVGSSDLFKLF